MKATILGVDFGKEKGGPFPIFEFRKGNGFFCFLKHIIVEETKSKISWKVIAEYRPLISYQKHPGQFLLWIGKRFVALSKRRPYFHTEVFDVGNNEQTELG